MMRYIATSLPPPADGAHWHPAPAPPPSPLFSILSSLAPNHFWLVVVSLLIHRPPSDPGYIFFAFFALFLHRKRWEFIAPSHLSHVLPPSHLLAGVSSSLIPSSQLSFDCWVVLSMVSTEGHSSIPPPYFLMRISVVAPKSQQPIMVRPIPWVGALLYGPIGSHGAMIWWRRWPAHGERGHHCLAPVGF